MAGADDAFYARRMATVIHFIAENLEADLSNADLAAQAGFSPFHFQRQFRAFTGISPMRLVRLLRLKRAAYQLAVTPEARVLDIALDAGFEAPESFWRAFRRAQGQSPSAFRQKPDWQAWSQAFSQGLGGVLWSQSEAPEIVEFPETPVAVLTYEGPPAGLMAAVLQFIDWRKSSGLSPVGRSMTLGIVHEKPESEADPTFRFSIAGSIHGPVPENPQGVVVDCIPGGRCARVRHRGSTAGLKDTLQALYGAWLPSSGARLRDFLPFFHYIKRLPTVSEADQITDIYLPLIEVPGG